MADAEGKETVGGVEPSITVRFVEATGPKTVSLSKTDNGVRREDFSVGQTAKLTEQDLVALAEAGAVIEKVENPETVTPSVNEPWTPTQPTAGVAPEVQTPENITPSPGQ